MDARGVESESESPGVQVLVRSQNLSFEEDSDSCPEFSNPGVGVKSTTKKQGLRIPDGCTDRDKQRNASQHHLMPPTPSIEGDIKSAVNKILHSTNYKVTTLLWLELCI